MRFNRIILLLPAIFILSVGAALTTPMHFAYEAELSEAKQALQRVEISLDVMLAATRADLGDVTVFDASGKPLPDWLRKATIAKSEKKFSLPIYLFNTYQQSSSKTLTTREQNQDQDQLTESTTTETVPVDQARQDYVIGIPAADEGLEIESIELVWTHEPADQLLKLKIEAGSDLDKWHTINISKSLTNQNSDDAQWRTISDIPKGEKYLRLTPINSIRSYEISRAIGNYSRPETVRKIWHSLKDVHEPLERPGIFKFDMPSSVPALELKLVPGEQQTSLTGDLHASQEGFEQKRLIAGNIQQHNISGSEIEPSKPIKVPQQNYAHWWFKPDQESTPAPQVEIAFPIYELLFLGNDNGPYTLAWGNHESEVRNDELISILNPEQRRNPEGELVKPGKMQIAGGEDRLTPQKKLPWQKWLLWLFLVIAAFTTGNMAISLYRDMNANQPTA